MILHDILYYLDWLHARRKIEIPNCVSANFYSKQNVFLTTLNLLDTIDD